MIGGRRILVAAAGLVVAALLGLPAATADALPAGTIGSFPTFVLGGTANAVTGTVSFAPPTIADAAVTSDAAAVTAASGASAFLGPGTGFGQEFGTTRAQPYLTIRPRSATPAPSPPSVSNPPPSTTTIDFGAGGPAAGWGFALGDIDADWVFVQAYDAAGAPLPEAELGERATGNYCDSSPRPSTCVGVVAPFDVPTWTGATPQTVAYGGSAITWAPGTVYGNVADTTGAYVWFTPTSAVHRITLLYGALSGSPVFQLWLAQPAPTTRLVGSATAGAGTPAPAGTEIELDDADGTPVAGLEGTPVTAPVGSDGTFSVVTEQRDAYRIRVIAPPGYEAPASVLVSPATAATTAVPGFTLLAIPPPAAPAAELAASGLAPDREAVLLTAGIGALTAGVLLLGRSRRRRRATPSRHSA